MLTGTEGGHQEKDTETCEGGSYHKTRISKQSCGGASGTRHDWGNILKQLINALIKRDFNIELIVNY